MNRRSLIAGAASVSAISLTACDLTGANVARVRFKVIARAMVDGVDKADALFVLLTDYLPVLLTLWDIPGPGSADETTIPRLRVADGSREIPRTIRKAPHREYPYYPRIAAFRNEADPASVYQVDPDNLAKTHGPGARFLGLSIEIVDPKTPLTDLIQQKLPWLTPGSTMPLQGPLNTRRPLDDLTYPESLRHGAFKSRGDS